MLRTINTRNNNFGAVANIYDVLMLKDFIFLSSGRRSILRIDEDTLTITLQENNTVIVAAKIYVEVAAKTWIWKGVNFGFLGCLKMNSCNGQIATYSANVDFQISFQV